MTMAIVHDLYHHGGLESVLRHAVTKMIRAVGAL
jgi:hypothetical protein